MLNFHIGACLTWGVRSDDAIQTGDIGWMITATALVLLMIPGVG